MNGQCNNRYPSTKFAALPSSDSIANARKNYFIWITIVTLIFCVTLASFSYKLFISPFLNDQEAQLFNNNNTYVIKDWQKNLQLKLYDPGPLLAGLKKLSQEDKNEFISEESQMQLETIPFIFIEQILKKDFQNLQDFINLDLLLHYENIINKYELKNLKLIFNEYQMQLILLKKSGNFVNFFASLKSDKFKFYADLLKQKKYDLELKNFKDFFVLTEELNYWYSYLHHLTNFLQIYEQQKVGKNLENCTEKNFEKFTEETQRRFYYFAYPFKTTKKKIQEINEVINMWSKPTTAEFHNCTVTLYNKVLLLSNIHEQIYRLNATCLKYLYIFASHIIYLDSDLKLFGVNLAMVAPNWVFLKKTEINLNGIAGRGFVNDTASFNRSGMPGSPGGNAGNFLGIGNPHEKFLIISAKGGKGGKGQNGAKGLDGTHFTRPGPPVSKPACVSKMNTHKNSFGQIITQYKIFSSFGCGQSGTDGGVGGLGGTGGIITLINASVKITKDLNGMTGTPGKGGVGGLGGQNGCFYEVLDVDDKTLHPITKVKCPIGNILPSGQDGKDNFNTKGQIILPRKENLTVQSTMHQFFRFARQDFVKSSDLNVMLLLKNLNQFDLYNKTSVRDLITEYKLLEAFNKIEFYEIFKEKILKYMQLYPNDSRLLLENLAAVILGKIMLLKENINFYFIDFHNYLNLLEKNIKNISEEIHESQSVSYFKKKVQIKIEKIKMNLNQIKINSAITLHVNSAAQNTKDVFSENNENNLSKLNKTILNIIIAATTVFSAVMNPVFNSAEKVKFNDSLKSLQENFSILYERTAYYKSITVSTKSFHLSSEKILQNTFENFRNKNSQEIKKYLSNLKDALCNVKESEVLSDEIRNLLESLTEEMEHAVAFYVFLEWEELERLFFESMNSLVLNSTSDFKEDGDLKYLRSRLVDVMITLQCKLAVHSASLNLYSFKNVPTCLQLLQNKTSTSYITNHKSFLQNINFEETDSFFKNHFKAVFDKHSAVGEFYFWSNTRIRNKLKSLFSGSEIKLKSDIINHHVFDKNLIQFSSLKLEFETGNKSQKHLQDILSYFRIKMIHSGYSYYNWKDETYISVSEEVSLEYSFKMQSNGEPEIYNSLYKKCQDGEIKLSPFTTWTLRLLPIKGSIYFNELMPFANSVNLRLIGTGTYIS